MAENFETMRPYIVDYLHMKGINPRRRFRCLNPKHLDRNPSMGYDANRQKVHCFACGADYDLFDLIAIDENLDKPSQALERAKQIFNREKTIVKAVIPNDYLSACHAHYQETTYFQDRGLSDQTIDRFLLGYDPKQDCVVLPCEAGHFIRRSISEKRYLNEKGQPSPLFQPELLLGDVPVFLVEGAFDALSAEELGHRACAMNGAGNREKVAEILRNLDKTAPIILLPDNDKAGKTWADALITEFPWLYCCWELSDCKDLNELLIKDREAAAQLLKNAEAAQKEFCPPSYSDSSAGNQMSAFERYIEEQANRPALKTGFQNLDRALDGGLYDGFYVIGAISSLGKTAFCMQVADQLAMAGHDVLIFSLEMTAYELMARSISRETFQEDESARRVMAKSVRGILDGKRYALYSGEEHHHIQAAKKRYAGYAKNLYFQECDHETSLEVIQKAIQRHIDETGRKPIVLIDYLQIIAPIDVHFTDKQNLDRIVCSLKKLSRSLSLTILAISSFNRENYNLEVSMAAFKETGGIDYSADVLLGLQAKGAGKSGFNIDEEKRKDPRELELKILKNRSAALGEPIRFRYYPAYSCFEEY